MKSRYIGLYEYRCADQREESLSNLARDNAYILVGALPKHRETALRILKDKSISSNKSNISVGTKEWLLEIEHFLRQGGYAPNK